MHKNCGKGNIIMVQLLYYQRKKTTTLEEMMRCLVPENKTYSQLQTFKEADKQKLRDLEKTPPNASFPLSFTVCTSTHKYIHTSHQRLQLS